MPDRPRGLLEPCAATSGKHGSEEGGAGKRRPLSDNREHYVRDRTFDEDRSQVRTRSSPQFLATARNIAISLLRLAGCGNIARGLEHLSRRLDHVLALLGVLPDKIRKEVMPTARLCL
jgi:hypothetical protein